MAINAKCIEKIRDNNNNIKAYILEDNSGVKMQITSTELKAYIKNNKIKLTNLRLTSDNKLIDCSDKEEYERVGTDELINIYLKHFVNTEDKINDKNKFKASTEEYYKVIQLFHELFNIDFIKSDYFNVMVSGKFVVCPNPYNCIDICNVKKDDLREKYITYSTNSLAKGQEDKINEIKCRIIRVVEILSSKKNKGTVFSDLLDTVADIVCINANKNEGMQFETKIINGDKYTRYVASIVAIINNKKVTIFEYSTSYDFKHNSFILEYSIIESLQKIIYPKDNNVNIILNKKCDKKIINESLNIDWMELSRIINKECENEINKFIELKNKL